MIDDSLQYLTIRYHGKEQITPAKSQRSIFQKGFRMIYANPVPIAAACQMGKEVVDDTLRTIFLALKDMLKFNYNICLQNQVLADMSVFSFIKIIAKLNKYNHILRYSKDEKMKVISDDFKVRMGFGLH